MHELLELLSRYSSVITVLNVMSFTPEYHGGRIPPDGFWLTPLAYCEFRAAIHWRQDEAMPAHLSEPHMWCAYAGGL